MNDDNRKLTGQERNLLRGLPMMTLAVIVVLGVLPLGYYLMEVSEGLLKDSKIRMTPNIDDGYLIAEFEDPQGDLLREIPEEIEFGEIRRALDIIEFSVKKVEFNPLAGLGIEPRVNLVFKFNGKLPNPQGSAQGFSLPALHVYIDTPGKNSQGAVSDRAADAELGKRSWDYQVIVDGMHELPRIFDREGNLLMMGLGLYVNYEPKEGVEPISWVDTSSYNERDVKYSSITAALPLKALGNPSEGKWVFYVLVGLADLRSSSMMYSSGDDKGTWVFDAVRPGFSNDLSIMDGETSYLFPLVLE
ncbi:hypothetical protein JXI42_00210 [bacterium]|nr:hypothetical protein [bacterium]